MQNRLNIQQVTKQLNITHRAVNNIEKQGLEITGISIGKSHPVLFIRTPDPNHAIRNTAQPFADLERVEISRFGKLDHQIVWKNRT